MCFSLSSILLTSSAGGAGQEMAVSESILTSPAGHGLWCCLLATCCEPALLPSPGQPRGWGSRSLDGVGYCSAHHSLARATLKSCMGGEAFQHLGGRHLAEGSGTVSEAEETAHTVFPVFWLCRSSKGKLHVFPSKIDPLRDSALFSLFPVQ